MHTTTGICDRFPSEHPDEIAAASIQLTHPGRDHSLPVELRPPRLVKAAYRYKGRAMHGRAAAACAPRAFTFIMLL